MQEIKQKELRKKAILKHAWIHFVPIQSKTKFC